MAADNANRLISKIVRERSIDPVLLRGVTSDWFLQPDDRRVFDFLLSHYQNYGEVPTGVTVKDNFPTYRLLSVEDALEYLVDQLVAHRRAHATLRMVSDAADLLDPAAANYEDVITSLRTSLAQLDSESVQASDLDLVADPISRYEEYLARKDRPDGLLGLPTGFPTIDRATAGLQPGQLVTIIASPKTGKSQLALKVASHIHEQGHTPLFQSFEMSNLEQQERFDALRAQVSHNRLRRGLLTETEEQRYRTMLETLGDTSFLLADSAAGTTVSAMAAKVSQRAPAVLFVDGVYLMIDEVTGETNTPQALTNITRSFKRLAQRLHIPIVLTTQTLLWKMRKNQISENSIGYSSSFLQDSDVVLGLERIEDEDDSRLLKVVASRNCGPASVECTWDWASGIFEEVEGTGVTGDDFVDDDDYVEEYGAA